MVIPVCSRRTADLHHPLPSTSCRAQSQATMFLVASKHHPRARIWPSTTKLTSIVNWAANLDPNHMQRGLNSRAKFQIRQVIRARFWSQLLGVHMRLIRSRVEAFQHPNRARKRLEWVLSLESRWVFLAF